jgi:hypothetical protein
MAVFSDGFSTGPELEQALAIASPRTTASGRILTAGESSGA